MKREKPKIRKPESMFYKYVENRGRKITVLLVLTVLMAVSSVQVWASGLVKSVDKDGNFVTNVDGMGVYAFLLNHMDTTLLAVMTGIYFLVLGASILGITIRLFQPNFFALPFALVIFSLALLNLFAVGESVNVPDNELVLFIEHQKIDESDVKSVYGDSGDLKTLSSALKSDADITVSSDESIELILVQGKDGKMTVYTVIGDAKNMDDFVLLGDVDDEDKLQVKTFFNSL